MIAIVDYNAGNTKSVKNAVNRLGYKCVITDNHLEIRNAEKVIIPGVGEANSSMKNLLATKLDVLIKNLKQPVLGICLGLQLMCKHSEEGDTHCLDIFSAYVKKFPNNNLVPQMGWNNLHNCEGNLFNGINRDNDVYFVHSYYAEVANETIAICNYGLPFSAAMQKDNFYGTQFHPEKSGIVGEIILQNFLNL
jgi:imidazole glycerol-phosphate synthase subunit HisH